MTEPAENTCLLDGRPTSSAREYPGSDSGGCLATSGRTLLLGLGNDILSDDAIGLRVVRELRQRMAGRENVNFGETTEMGLALLDLVVDYECLVLIDSVQTGRTVPGFMHELGLEDLQVLPLTAPHFLGIGELLALGHQLGFNVPRQVRILAIEVQDAWTVSAEMTPALEAALPHIVEDILTRWF